MLKKISYIPLSVGLMFFPSTVLNAVLDGAESTYYGFPLPWNSRSIVTSLSKDIYLIPLLLDLIFYAFVGFIAWRGISKYLYKFSTVQVYASLIIWSYGIIATWILVSILFIDPVIHTWFPYDFKIVSIKFGACV
jgi:hypothetical protein